jgi:hypothetical protein
MQAAWTGGAADAAESKLRSAKKNLDDVHDRVVGVGTALSTFADELDVAIARMETARSIATSGGLTVSGDCVEKPAEPDAEATDGPVNAYNAKVTAWNSAVGHAEDGRAKETEAHSHLGDTLQKFTGDGFLEKLLEGLGFKPPSDLGVPGDVLWGVGGAGTGGGIAANWMIKGRYGIFQPRVNGQFASPSAFSAWQRGLMSGDDANWHALPNAAGTRDAWKTAGKWVGRAGSVASFGAAAWEQWEADVDDPSLDDTARVARSATVGATTAAGAWAGAEAGAWVGGAIGTAICPGVGTVVGGALGGLIGGFAGSELGGMVGDAVKDSAGKAADAVSDFAGAVGKGVGKVGKAIKFW